MVADRQDVRGAVGDPHPGVGRRDLRDGVGVLGDGMVAALLVGRDAQRGGVVVGAVDQREAPVRAAGGVQHAGDGGGPVGAQHRGGRLDLQLEPQCTRRDPVRRHQPGAQRDQRRDLVDGAHLRACDRQRRRVPARGQVRLEEQVQGPHCPGPGVGLQALAPQPGERDRPAGRPEHRTGGTGGGVLLGVGTAAVTVFEVDAQVLHRLARQLRDDPLAHRGQERRGDPEDLGQLGVVAAVLRQSRGTRCAPRGDRARVVAVRGNVHGVHGTAAGGGTRVPGGEQGVGGGEARVELAQQCLATGLPHATPLRSGPPRTVWRARISGR